MKLICGYGKIGFSNIDCETIFKPFVISISYCSNIYTIDTVNRLIYTIVYGV